MTTSNNNTGAMPEINEKSEQASCCCRTTARDAETKKKLMNRLSKIEGQVRGIKTMLDNDAYCNDILIQSAAVNSAINSFNKVLLAEHMKTCVVRDIKNGKEEEIIEELVTTMQKLMK